MGLASILSGQASLTPFAEIPFQPADLEQLTTIAWQWLVLSAVAAWFGSLIAGYRLLNAFRGQQQTEIAAVLHIAAQRQRRQGWLWLCIIFVGNGALFWLRLPHVLGQPLNQLPNWSALGMFVFFTPEGWLWLARGALALLALGLALAFSISARRQARTDRPPDYPARSGIIRRRWQGRVTRQRAQNAFGFIMSGSRSYQPASSDLYPSTASASLEHRFLMERRHTQIHFLVVIALLCSFLLPLFGGASDPLPITSLTLNGAVLLALAFWVGGVLYLASILAPASHIIESAERTQTLVETFSASRPAIAPASIAIAVYGVFSVETHLTTFNNLNTLLHEPMGWFLSAELVLLAAMLLLTFYQARRALPFLAQAAWLATRGTVMSVLGGIDVSRSLQMSQHERQMIANQAERRFTRLAYAQVVLGVLMLLCLVLTWVYTRAPTLEAGGQGLCCLAG
jgi:uncharacterized membrane protein